MNNPEFWQFFETEAAPQLAHRQASLRYVFNHLDQLNRPVFVIETGCVRNVGTWSGEGQSTILFDKFASSLPGSVVHSVDLNPEATALCRQLVSAAVEVHTGDSVTFLRSLAKAPPPQYPTVDVLYLDSYDVDFSNPHPSAMHHMKELLAISPLIGPNTLVVVDDAPLEACLIPTEGGVAFITACLIPTEGGVAFITQPSVGGKGKYVAEYARNIGLAPVFSAYQAGWIGF